MVIAQSLCSVPPASDASYHCGSLMAERQLNQTVLVLKYQIQGQPVPWTTSKKRKSPSPGCTQPSLFFSCVPQCLDDSGEAETKPVRDPWILGAVPCPQAVWGCGLCCCCSPAVASCNTLLQAASPTRPGHSQQQQTHLRSKTRLKNGLKRDVH